MEKYMTRTKEEYNVDQRQYLCISKYDKIVSKFDELVNMVDTVTKAPKRRRGSSSNSRSKMVRENGGRSVKVIVGAEEKSCPDGIKGSTPSSADNDKSQTGGGALVQLITNHLLDLNSPHHKA